MQDQLLQALNLVAADRHKLVILLGGFGSGKTKLLQALAPQVGGVYVNLNLQLTERLLTVPQSRYNDGVTVHRLIDELCDELAPDRRPLFIDNVELLFSPEVGRINPVDTFKRISRQRQVVLALPAQRRGNNAVYSALGREDYMSIPLETYPVIELQEED
ncbi:MAG: BREX-3 system P-loop-containing protein BrxF [Anaerolineae bacterium]|nr:BREX-3 system P-loop-containing protein BrxF [Anaerolineae bacterium]